MEAVIDHVLVTVWDTFENNNSIITMFVLLRNKYSSNKNNRTFARGTTIHLLYKLVINISIVIL